MSRSSLLNFDGAYITAAWNLIDILPALKDGDS
jgi:hypothetical protein